MLIKALFSPIRRPLQLRNMQAPPPRWAAVLTGTQLIPSLTFILKKFCRYVVLVYSQPSTFKAPTAFSQANMGVSTFDFNAYVTVRPHSTNKQNPALKHKTSFQDSGLGALVAVRIDCMFNAKNLMNNPQGTYFTVEEGTATASISSTSAVVSSTLLAATSQTQTDAGAASSTGTSPSATESSKSGASSLATGFTAGIATLALAVLLL